MSRSLQRSIFTMLRNTPESGRFVGTNIIIYKPGEDSKSLIIAAQAIWGSLPCLKPPTQKMVVSGFRVTYLLYCTRPGVQKSSTSIVCL